MPNELLTKRDVAAALGVHISTVNRMVTSGRLKPAQTIEGATRTAMYLFRRSDVDRVLARRAA